MDTNMTLLQLLQRPEIVIAPGAYDALTARLVEQAGFPAVYMTGAGTSAALGYPDYGLVTMTEMVDNAGRMARSVGLPLIADADTGYGNELNVIRTVREFESRGVSAIHIEDQVSPKRCGHLDGKVVIRREDFVSKIRAAVSARRSADFLIIARTDARAVVSFQEAVDRANLALAAGADMVFIEATQTLEEVAAVPRLVSGPCMLNVVPGGKTPALRMDEAQAMGYRLAIFPVLLFKAVVEVCDEALAAVKATQLSPAGRDTKIHDLFRRAGADEWDAQRDQFKSFEIL